MPVTLNFCFIISPRDFCLLRSCGALCAPAAGAAQIRSKAENFQRDGSADLGEKKKKLL